MNEKAPFPAANAPGPRPEVPSFAPALSPLRERFCRYYLTEPSATRAAVRAGYSEHTARKQASRLLTSVDILQRIDAIRRSEHLVYELSPQAVMDRCEAIFEEALEKGRYEAAIGALRLQARIGGLLKPDAPQATKQDLAGVVEHCVRTAVSRYVAFGTLGALNPLTPPPWVPGEEAARRQRRKMEKELADTPDDAALRAEPAAEAAARAAAAARAEAEADARADAEQRERAGWPPRAGTLVWPHDEASLFRAAVGHDDDHCRAEGWPVATPRLPDCAPPEAHAERARAYALGRTPEPGAVERRFPPEDAPDEGAPDEDSAP
jgi:hypothetical protein